MAKNFGGATDFKAKPAKQTAGTKKLLNADKSPPFQYKHHPDRWQCVNGEWLPLLGILRHEPGINGVTARGGTTIAVAGAMNRDWTIIPWKAYPEGGDTGYCQSFDGRDGDVHVSVWERPKQVGARVIWQRDDDGFYAFLRRLVVEGVVPKPDPDILMLQIETQRTAVQRAGARDTRGNAAAAALYDQAVKRLAEMEAAFDRLFGEGEPESEPAPTKRKRGEA